MPDRPRPELDYGLTDVGAYTLVSDFGATDIWRGGQWIETLYGASHYERARARVGELECDDA